MSDPVLPSFLRYPQEAEIVARLLAGYREVQFELCHCLAVALGPGAGCGKPGCFCAFETAIRVMFGARGEEARVEFVGALAAPKYEAAGVGQVYWEAVADLRYCRQIRNQFAHCRWRETSNGLGFVDVQETQKLTPNSIDAPLLAAQRAYFKYVQKCFEHLAVRCGKRPGKSTTQDFPLPKKLARPPMHNGPL